MSHFTDSSDAACDRVPWGELAWLCRPASSNAKSLVVVEVALDPHDGHGFHKHPDQEEVVYVLEGKVEQWVGRNKRTLGPGDSAFIPADTVHASFNPTDEPSRILAILGPSLGSDGYELVDVADQEPWASIR